MKRFFSLILSVAALNLLGCGLSAKTTPESSQERLFSDTIIHQDMTWSGDIAIRGVFVVGRGATLTIHPGTTVRFQKIDSNNDQIGDSEIRVLGQISAVGTKEAPIRSTGASL